MTTIVAERFMKVKSVTKELEIGEIQPNIELKIDIDIALLMGFHCTFKCLLRHQQAIDNEHEITNMVFTCASLYLLFLLQR